MEWFINIGGTISSLVAIFYFLMFFKYKFVDKTTTLKVNIYSTLTEHYKEALSSNPEDVRKYFLKTFPINETQIIPNEFISEKRRNIIAEISLTNPNNLAVIVGSDDNAIKILNFYDSKGKIIDPIKVEEREDIPNKDPNVINKGQLNLDKGNYVSILIREVGYESAQKMEIKIRGHKEIIVLTPNQKHGAIKYIHPKNTIKSYIAKLL
ncbi:hypothetical protein [Staphylococcus equorum]|uniref:hypothetical protein n=1 Tax=Staphylococcus equorum TaxID=246432 RepID=UPI001F54490B|nr:hypothetical protein [Staphylococcus equorum]